eukprot:6483660-Amphidinium_carterae.5
MHVHLFQASSHGGGRSVEPHSAAGDEAMIVSSARRICAKVEFSKSCERSSGPAALCMWVMAAETSAPCPHCEEAERCQ